MVSSPFQIFRCGFQSISNLLPIGKSRGVSNPSYPKLISEFLQWHPMLIYRYLNDKFFRKIFMQAKNFGRGYILHNGILYFTMHSQVRLCIPDSVDCNVHIRNVLLHHMHLSLGHASYSKTYHALASHFYWPQMAKGTFEYCRTCGICQRIKQSTQHLFGLLKPLPIPETPFTHISMDFLFLPKVTNKTMQVSYDHVWVIVDRFSKYTIILPLPLNYTAEHLINVYYNSVYSFFDLPQDIITDRDVLFTSMAWKRFCIVNNISQSMSSAYHSKTDRQSEIAKKSIITILCFKLLEQGLDWLAAIPSMQVAINTGIDASRDASPHTLCIRCTPKFEKGVVVPAASLRPDIICNALWDSVKTKLIRSRIAITQQVNKCRCHSPQYQVRDLVKVLSSYFPKDTQFLKLEPVFMGPYKIFHYFPETDNYMVEILFACSAFLTVYISLLAP